MGSRPISAGAHPPGASTQKERSGGLSTPGALRTVSRSTTTSANAEHRDAGLGRRRWGYGWVAALDGDALPVAVAFGSEADGADASGVEAQPARTMAAIAGSEEVVKSWAGC